MISFPLIGRANPRSTDSTVGPLTFLFAVAG
jgi:hypothetical protein